MSLVAYAPAADKPIAGARLGLKRKGATQRLVFRSNDPELLFPALRSADDPAAGSPGGALIEIFSASEGTATHPAPRAGWTAVDRTQDVYRFAGRRAPGSTVTTAWIRQGRGVAVTGTATGLPLAVAQGTVGIRITTGTIRNCALFGPSTVRHDSPGSFSARNAPASALTDCSDASLGGPPTTTTFPPGACEISAFPACGGTCPAGGTCVPEFGVGCGCRSILPSMPCGDTSPLCSGTCGAGETCATVGDPTFPSCYCLPTGNTPCGSPGIPSCGGACPAGTECNPTLPYHGSLACECTPPGERCPNGWAWALIPQFVGCSPIGCSGSYPTCGGSCGDGGVCTAFSLDSASGGGAGSCLCAVPGACDTSCGGWDCASGQVCHVNAAAGTCGCGAP